MFFVKGLWRFFLNLGCPVFDQGVVAGGVVLVGCGAMAADLPRPIVAVGHSSGAVAVLEAALREPQAFAGLVLYEPPLATARPIAGAAGIWARASLDAGDPIGAVRIHMRGVVGMPVSTIDAMFADPAARAVFCTYAAAQVADNEALDALGVGIDRYRELRLPVVLIGGTDSPAHLRERMADLAGVLPNVQRVVSLAGQGHVAHMTAPAMLADVVRQAAEDLLAQNR